MTAETAGIRPPQQARSRAALQRLLAAAEYVLVKDGADEFTIARVAERAGVSVGGVYRRFAGREQLIDAVRQDLLTRLDEAISTALAGAEPSLPGVLTAFAGALSEILAASGQVIPAIIAGPRLPDAPAQAAGAVTGLQQRFRAAAAPHRAEINHPDPNLALDIAFRTVMAAAVHRAAVVGWWPDGLEWDRWAVEIAGMATAYLATAGRRPR